MSMLMTLPKPGEHFPKKHLFTKAAHKGRGADASAFMAAPNGGKGSGGAAAQHGDDFLFYIYIFFFFLFVFHVFREKQG